MIPLRAVSMTNRPASRPAARGAFCSPGGTTRILDLHLVGGRSRPLSTISMPVLRNPTILRAYHCTNCDQHAEVSDPVDLPRDTNECDHDWQDCTEEVTQQVEAWVTEQEKNFSPPSITRTSTPLFAGLQRVVDANALPQAPHVIVTAYAGTGKTTTIIEGLKFVMGGHSDMTPSPQQDAVWREMAKSAGVARMVCFCAFNRSIKDELAERVPKGVEALTMHGLGFRAVRKAYPRVDCGDGAAKYRVQDIICRILETDSKTLRKNPEVLLVANAAEELVSKCKMNLVGCGSGKFRVDDVTDDDLDALVDHYEIEMNNSKGEVFALVPMVLEECLDAGKDNRCNYDDMIWLPIALNLYVQQYDLLLVDEAQDLNRCQQALAKRAGKRLIFVGDARQAIYGFCGADVNSIPNLRAELEATNRGCVTLPLTVTRRCGRAIVKEANKYVKDFAAHDTCPAGKVSTANYLTYTEGFGPNKRKITREHKDTYMPLVRDGDFVLCRTNAPLVKNCFTFIKRGIRANIQGRDIGTGLIGTIKKILKVKGEPSEVVTKLRTIKTTDVISAIDAWLSGEVEKEQARKNPSDEKIDAMKDRAMCLRCFTDEAKDAAEVVRKIEDMFTDSKDRQGVRLSSVHKAKGLEAQRVFILQPDDAPQRKNISAWQQEQEDNLLYVAITRAISELIWVR